MTVKVGTAGWTIPKQNAELFPAQGTSLQRYASRFPVAEINSSFHRPHRLSTWERWRESVPDDFRFSVKLPKTITHQRKLVDCGDLLDQFVPQLEALGDKLAVLLVQLPPKLDLNTDLARRFFTELKARTNAAIACEPRHLSWFEDAGEALLKDLQVARVAADPAICSTAALPGGWRGLSYWRLHGSPQIYRSSYADRTIENATMVLDHDQADSWCIFDNTASSAATGDALAMQNRIAAAG